MVRVISPHELTTMRTLQLRQTPTATSSTDDGVFLISGASATASAIAAELVPVVPVGSIYFCTAGKVFKSISAGGTSADWVELTTSGAALASAVTDVTATAAEVDKLAGVTAGTAAASKVAVLGTNKQLDTLVIGSLKLGSGAGTAVTAIAADLNILASAKALTSGTTLTDIKLSPTASAATASINQHKLMAIGDVTGTTAYGFGDPAKPTTGLMASFGRTVATSAGVTDTGLDVRVINRLPNDGANNMQGAYVKAKNYSTGTIGGDLVGLFVETVNDGGTVTGKAIGIKIGCDGTAIDADMQFSNGARLVALTTAITVNSTTTSSPAGSIGITTNGTGVGKLFVSDGSKWQYMAVA